MKITWIVPHFPPHIGGGERLYMDVCLFLKDLVTNCSKCNVQG